MVSLYIATPGMIARSSLLIGIDLSVLVFEERPHPLCTAADETGDRPTDAVVRVMLLMRTKKIIISMNRMKAMMMPAMKIKIQK